MAAAHETLAIWDDELDFGELADDIAVEARLALTLTAEIDELEERIAVMYSSWWIQTGSCDPFQGSVPSTPPRSSVASATRAVFALSSGSVLQRTRALTGRLGAERPARRTDEVG